MKKNSYPEAIIAGNWNGLGVYTNDKLALIKKGLITASINGDNTFKFTVNGTELSGVWSKIDSAQLDSVETAFNFISWESEQVAKAVLSHNGTIDENSTFILTIIFDESQLKVQFEKQVQTVEHN